MVRYTRQEIRDLKKGKGMSKSDRKIHLQMLADKWERPFNGVQQAYNRSLVKKNTKVRKYAKRNSVPKQALAATMTGIVSVPFRSIEIDMNGKVLKLHI